MILTQADLTTADVALILDQADKSTVDIALILAQADKSTVDIIALDLLLTEVRTALVDLGLMKGAA